MNLLGSFRVVGDEIEDAGRVTVLLHGGFGDHIGGVRERDELGDAS